MYQSHWIWNMYKSTNVQQMWKVHKPKRHCDSQFGFISRYVMTKSHWNPLTSMISIPVFKNKSAKTTVKINVYFKWTRQINSCTNELESHNSSHVEIPCKNIQSAPLRPPYYFDTATRTPPSGRYSHAMTDPARWPPDFPPTARRSIAQSMNTTDCILLSTCTNFKTHLHKYVASRHWQLALRGVTRAPHRTTATSRHTDHALIINTRH